MSATTADPVLVNNAASATTTVDPVADLSLTKTDSPDPVLSGQQLTYTLAVHNDGPASAPSVSLSDALPARRDLRVRHAHAGQLRAPRQHRHLRARHDRERRERHRRDQGRRGRSRHDHERRDRAVHGHRPEHGQQLRQRGRRRSSRSPTSGLTKSDSPDPVLAGQLLTYTLGVSNAGPHAAAGVTVTDTCRPTSTFDSASASQGSCSESARHGHVRARHGRQRRDGERRDQGPAAQPRARVTNQASVTSDAGDLNPSNNSASAQTTVDPAADLQLTKTDSPDPVAVRAAAHLHPHGAQRRPVGDERRRAERHPARRRDVRLRDHDPGQLLQVGQHRALLARDPRRRGDRDRRDQGHGAGARHAHQQRQRASASMVDPDTADNAASADTTVNPAADLSLTKSDSPDPVQAGELLTYTLGVQNAGPAGRDRGDAHRHAAGRRDVRVRHADPGHLLRVRAAPSPARSGRSRTAASASVEIKVRPQEGGQITNQASVGSDVGRSGPGQQLGERRRRP